jgi:5-methylcytosine-specific restriction endonuclease McrA
MMNNIETVSIIIEKLECFRGNYTAQNFLTGGEIKMSFKNDYLSDIVVKTSNKKGGVYLPRGKMWSILFGKVKDFENLPNYRILSRELQKIGSDLKITPDRSGVRSHGLRLYNMSENPTADILIDVLNFIFCKDEKRIKLISAAKKEIERQTVESIVEESSLISKVATRVLTVSSEADPTVLYAPREVRKVSVRKGISRYARNPEISKEALRLAGYRCELCDEPLRLFIRKSDEKTNYTEPHHLIPVSFQDALPESKSLDNVANIVSLCSHCHNLLHYGRYGEKKVLIEKLFNEREGKLRMAGIMIDIETILEIYK